MRQIFLPAALAALMLTDGQARASGKIAPIPFAAQAGWPAGTWASPSFTPDGQTMVITLGSGASRHLMISHRQDDLWSVPEVAPFSGKWMDIEAAMAPDGSYLVFASNRPLTAKGQPLDGLFGGQARPGRGGNLWRVDRNEDTWGQPVHLPDTVNVSTSIFAPSVASNGDLFFMKAEQTSGRFRLYQSRLVDGNYTTPEPLTFSDDADADVDPVVAPDESFIIFSSNRPPAPKDGGQSAIFIAHSSNGRWAPPQPFSPTLYGVEARLAPDLRSLYFLSDRPTPDSSAPPAGADSQRIWSIPFSATVTPQSHGTYRLPFADGTHVKVFWDFTTHRPPGRVDILAIDGSGPYRVVAAAAGRIAAIEDGYIERQSGGPGVVCHQNFVWIAHPNGEWTNYSHVAHDSVSKKAALKVGDEVKAGQYIGDEGEVGCAMFPHVHFEVAVPDSKNPIDSGGFLNDNEKAKRERNPRFCGVPGENAIEGQVYTAAPCGKH